jgi:RNA polymerase sigma-70 factor (ECF subfamily)
MNNIAHRNVAPNSEESAALHRQIDLVYAFALRQTRDTEMAADVTQAVFLVLARKQKAGHGPPEKFIRGWLFKVASFAVREARRAAARRAHHERRAAMNAPETVALTEKEKAELVAMVDASMLRLSAMDREVIVRRYLQGESLADVAAAVGMSENTAGRRVARALAKLRKMVAGRGVHASSSVIAAVAGEQALVHAPASAVAGVVSATAAPQVAVLSNAVLTGMLVMKAIKIGVVAAAVMAVCAGAWVEVRAWAQPAATQAQATAPTDPALTVTSVLEENSDTLLQNQLALFEKERFKIKTVQVDARVRQWRESPSEKQLVESLLIEGRAWVETTPPRRSRIEVSRYRDAGAQAGNDAAPREQSFVEVWDGEKTRLLYGPPLSPPAAAVRSERQPIQDLLAGSDFSLQLLHGPSLLHNQTPGPHPLARESFYGYVVTARRVMLQGDKEAVEFSMNPPRQDKVQQTFWLDPQRGHALLGARRIYTAPEVPRTETVVVDTLEEVAPGIFFPKTAHSATWDPKTGAVTSRTEFEARQVVVNQLIPENTFDLAFPSGVAVRDFGNPAAQAPSSQPAASTPAEN